MIYDARVDYDGPDGMTLVLEGDETWSEPWRYAA